MREEGLSASEATGVEGVELLLQGMLGEGRFSRGMVIHGCLRISSRVGLSQALSERHL